MSTQTAIYGFVKPEITDPSDITSLNGNWDTVENELNELQETVNNNNESVTEQLALLQPKITYGTSEPSGGNPGDVYIQLLEV